jgi:molybdopterin synthase catalytic subunit
MNKVKVMFYATLRDEMGARSLELDLDEGATVRTLKDRLSQDRPATKAAIERALVAVNREYAPDDKLLPENAEVALFPPVSGG